MPYAPALDGLRAIAILLVVLFHARAPFAPAGFVGVDLFFVLSGYLITSLLLGEFAAAGRVDLPRFYWRRMLRLTPALLTLLAAYVAAAPLLWPEITDHGAQAAVAAAYLSDYGYALWRTPDILNHTWSLSIEAHFYLIWPLVLVAASRRCSARQIVLALALAYVAATFWRWACLLDGQSWNLVYYRFDTRLSGLVLGSWLAAMRRDAPAWAGLQRYLPAAGWWMPAFVIVCLRFAWGNTDQAAWGFSLVEWCAVALLIAALNPASTVARMLSQPRLVWLGKMSYGVYLWHYPVFRYLRASLQWECILVLGLSVSIALAALSYYTVEAWARRSGHFSRAFQ